MGVGMHVTSNIETLKRTIETRWTEYRSTTHNDAFLVYLSQKISRPHDTTFPFVLSSFSVTSPFIISHGTRVKQRRGCRIKNSF